MCTYIPHVASGWVGVYVRAYTLGSRQMHVEYAHNCMPKCWHVHTLSKVAVTKSKTLARSLLTSVHTQAGDMM